MTDYSGLIARLRESPALLSMPWEVSALLKQAADALTSLTAERGVKPTLDDKQLEDLKVRHKLIETDHWRSLGIEWLQKTARPKCLTKMDGQQSVIEPSWLDPATAPTDTNLLTWGGGQMRFMRKDALGQWRNMMHRPKPTPKYWAQIPKPPEQ